jgi:SDR family mycofactocin-dependent oxidoreductase
VGRVEGRVEGKVVLITGAARGQGRSHALRFAAEGADVVAVDLGPTVEGVDAVGSVPYGLPDASDLDETAVLVRGLGRRAVAVTADVRDQAALEKAVAIARDELGGLDIVCANAGILSSGPLLELTPDQWHDTLEINLTGVWHTIRAAAPALIDRGGGAIVATNSLAGLKGVRGSAAYASAKHGLVGLVRSAAHELGPHRIRVNGVHPTSVATPMVHNPAMSRALRPDLDDPSIEDTAAVRQAAHLLPIPWIEPEDVSNAVLWLASDEARYVTGVALPVDAGASIK